MSDSNILFSVETTLIDDNRKLGKALQDKDGYFCNVPVAVLGDSVVTRNNTSYDREAFIKQLKGPESTFYHRLVEGNLFSEYNHPAIDPTSKAGMARLMRLDRAMEACHIRKVSVEHVADLGIDLVTADVKPSGPYGKFFAELMLDPTRNCAYSLRGLSSATRDKRTGVIHKKLLSLVTFDTSVPSGGFKEASKRYMSSENLSIEGMSVDAAIAKGDLATFHEVAMESLVKTELNDILKTNSITLGTRVTGYVSPNLTVVDAEAEHGLFHSIMTSKR